MKRNGTRWERALKAGGLDLSPGSVTYDDLE